MDLLAKVSDLFETYRVHDSVIGLIGYKCGMISGLLPKNSQLGSNLKSVSSQISNARVILRFLDDYPMLTYTLTYGLGRSEKNLIVRVLTVFCNLSYQVYYITEHLAYFADNKLINADSGIYWFISILAWLISLLAQLTCNLISLYELVKLNRNEDTKDEHTKTKRNRLRKYFKKGFIKLYLKLLEDIFWLINCIHWMPGGFLWSNKLTDFSSGLFGVLATVCGLLAKV